MSTRIHPQARTTTKIRQEIKDSGLSDLEAVTVGTKTPIQALKEWRHRKPELFGRFMMHAYGGTGRSQAFIVKSDSPS